MLTLSADALTLLAQRHVWHYPHFVAEIGNRSSATLEQIDLSDRVLTYQHQASLNDATQASTVTLIRGVGTESLNPAIPTSTLRFDDGRHVLDPGVRYLLGVRLVDPTGSLADQTVDFVWGRMDRVNASSAPGEVTVTGRDLGAEMLNRFIRRVRMRGSSGGRAVESVMRDIMVSESIFGDALTVPSSPGYQITPYAQAQQPVLEALRILAQQIGWDVRFFMADAIAFSGVGAVAFDHTVLLRLYDPGRERTTPDLTIGPERYERITELAWGDEDVRNDWEVWYPDAEDPVHVEDLTSIGLYGRRWAGIHEDRTSNIRTLAAATTLAEMALADTKDPLASHSIDLPVLPQVELNDLHTYEPDGETYDADQTFAVAGFTHSYANGDATTTIQGRGKPIAAYREYRQSKMPAVVVSSIAPPANRTAPEGTVWEHVPDLITPEGET